MEGTSGVERVSSLGKFAAVGKVTFTDKNMMWDFINAHRGVKLPYIGVPRQLWFSIEETND